MIPLADRMRPQTLEEFVGQKHIIDSDKLLFKAINNKQIFSMIFWGPPGVGKTTLARIIAKEMEADFMEFSAVNTGIAELKKIFEGLKNQNSHPELVSGSDKEIPKQVRNDKLGQTIIFIDEIHRFSKAQQDAFLPYVEAGIITLIGATTENPSFEIISPLLSRSRVLTLKALEREDLLEIINRALKDKEKGLGKFKVKLDKNALDFLIEISGGDARAILNTLELAITSFRHPGGSPRPIGSQKTDSIASLQNDKEKVRNDVIKITKEIIEEAVQTKALMYDKGGEEHYNTISAFIKSMRASNVDASLYYLARMVEAGEDPLFIARRMVIFASEDIGMALPTALVVANEVFRACETIGYPECQINLAHGVVYLSSAKKDRSAYEGYFKALEDVKTFGNLPIPLNLRNAPTKLMKSLGYGKGYEKYTDENLLPEKLKGKKYY